MSLTPDETLAFVKRDIGNSSLASDDDPELYAPLFRNISTFKRYIQRTCIGIVPCAVTSFQPIILDKMKFI